MAALNLYAQDKSDPRTLMPKRFIDKVEIIVGPSITFPNGSDQSAFNNPRISTGYYAKGGYLFGVGLIHSIGKFELRSRILWNQKGYVQKLWDNEPTGQFEFINETKNNFLSINLTPVLFFGKKNRFHVLLGVSYSQLINSESIQTLLLDGKTQSVFRTTNASSQGINNQLVEVIAGFGCLVYSKNKKEISATMQGDFGLTDTVNQNGTIIRNRSLNLIVALKIIS